MLRDWIEGKLQTAVFFFIAWRVLEKMAHFSWNMDERLYLLSGFHGWMDEYTEEKAKESHIQKNSYPCCYGNRRSFGVCIGWHLAWLGYKLSGVGRYNGVILAVSAILVDEYAVWKNKLHIDSQAGYWKVISLIRTLLIVTIGWIFDCTYTAGAAGKLFIHLFEFGKTDLSVISLTATDIAVLFVGCFVLLIVDVLHEKNLEVRQIIETKNYWVQVAFWTIVIQMIACFGRVASAGGFMYANF